MNIYNKDKIVRIYCGNFKESPYYEYRSELKFLGIRIRREGFYGIFDSYIGRYPPDNHIFKDGKVLEKPELVIYYQNNHARSFSFDSYEELLKYRDKITNQGNWH